MSACASDAACPAWQSAGWLAAGLCLPGPPGGCAAGVVWYSLLCGWANCFLEALPVLPASTLTLALSAILNADYERHAAVKNRKLQQAIDQVRWTAVVLQTLGWACATAACLLRLVSP